MKYLFILLSTICLLPQMTFASQPMEPRPLKERVESATYIFVGVIEKIIAVDENFREIPDDKLPEISNFVLLQVRVKESLTSPDWHPSKPVIAGFGGIWMSVKEMKERQTGESAVFLTNMVQIPQWGPVLVPSYGYFLNEPMEKKAEIQKLLKPNTEGGELWNHFERLAQCLRDAESVQVGITREKVETMLYKVWEPTTQKEKYVFKKYPYVTMEIEFARKLTTRDDALDTVTQVSKPYLEWVRAEG